MSDKAFPTCERGAHDSGLPERPRPCAKRTWCVLTEHEGNCEEVARYHIEPSDFGPAAAKRRRY